MFTLVLAYRAERELKMLLVAAVPADKPYLAVFISCIVYHILHFIVSLKP